MINKRNLIGLSKIVIVMAVVLASFSTINAQAAVGDFYNQTTHIKFLRADLASDSTLADNLQGQMDAGNVVIKEINTGKYLDYGKASVAFLGAIGNHVDTSIALGQAITAGKTSATKEILDAYAQQTSDYSLAVSSVSAINGTTTVTFNNALTTTPSISDFAVTQTIGTGATIIIPTGITMDSTMKIATLTMPIIATTAVDQSVVYGISYKSATIVNSTAIIIKSASSNSVTLGALQKYTLTNTYVISNTKNGDSGNLLNTKATLILGTDVLSPYILNMSDFKVSEGTLSKDVNGVYTLTDIIASIAPNTSNTITAERTFTTGTIDYNIDKSTITSDYSELPNYTDYLKADVKVEVNDAGIKAKAKALTTNITNVYDKAFAIFKFVNTNMTYSLLSPYANTGAVSALTHKVGVCEDYSQLFVALCRASGIPARTVTGYRNGMAESSTTIDVTKERHMWAEVYFPNYGWTIVEPTVSFSRVPSDSDLLKYFGKALTPAEHIATGYDYAGGTSVSSSYDRATVSKPTMLTVVTSTLYVDGALDDALAAATSSVTNAETSKLQSDLDSAKALVNALTDSTDKTSLLSRINVLQTIIDANQVEYRNIIEATRLSAIAYQTPTRTNYNIALVAVNNLKDGTNKYSLQRMLVSSLNVIVTNETNNNSQKQQQ
ncbi:hypothetical protein K2F43_20605 [Clostridium estertheticum]|uniref:transglutaminase domain-containing protein n=1 Tax=Clostridium estertheticum TaxID=238834 RepID=UPI001C6E6379|nr:transglutaminase domain-containing protein [Clostridium estertheticum]MBW9173591.1 hypothetical protein [Clostridium estertheticum]WLC75224.1 hypothetical protein KTC99_21325 [Clostridium estertheticum]